MTDLRWHPHESAGQSRPPLTAPPDTSGPEPVQPVRELRRRVLVPGVGGDVQVVLAVDLAFRCDWEWSRFPPFDGRQRDCDPAASGATPTASVDEFAHLGTRSVHGRGVHPHPMGE